MSDPNPSMRLYTVTTFASDPTLISGLVIKVTPQFYFVDNTALNQWSTRVPKADVGGMESVMDESGNLATIQRTPKLAWEAFITRERNFLDRARRGLEVATRNLEIAQGAYAEILDTEPKYPHAGTMISERERRMISADGP